MDTRIARCIVLAALLGATWLMVHVLSNDPFEWLGWLRLVTETDTWAEADAALRRKWALLISVPAVAVVLLCYLVSTLRGLGSFDLDDEREAQVRLRWNLGSLGELARSNEIIAAPVSKGEARLQAVVLRLPRQWPPLLMPYWLHSLASSVPSRDGAALRVFLARPRSFVTLPQLLVGLLPVPLAAATMNASFHLAIQAVCCGGFSPAQWVSWRESSYAGLIGTPGGIDSPSIYVASVAVAFLIVRLLWPAGRANLAVSFIWAFFPMLFAAASSVFGTGFFFYGPYIFSPAYWTAFASFFWPGDIWFSLHWFFLLLFVLDALLYYLVQRQWLFVTDGSSTCFLSGRTSDRRWKLVQQTSGPPQLLRLRARPLGAEVWLRVGESSRPFGRTLACSTASLRQAREMLAAMGVDAGARSTRRYFAVELVIRCGWILGLYVWLASAFVGVAHSNLRTSALMARVVRATSGYDIGPVAGQLRRETDFVLGIDPDLDLALYFRARLLEEEGKDTEAEAIYQRLIARSRWNLAEARAQSPPYRLLITGQKVRNACNVRLMMMNARREGRPFVPPSSPQFGPPVMPTPRP